MSAQMDQISYNDFGQATSIRIGGGAANPLTEQYTFDANTGLMTNQKVKRGSTSIMDLSYYYARDLSKGSLNGTTGNLTKIINNLDRNKDRKYEYDTLGRLIKAKGGVAAGGSGVANWTQTYNYDRYGNKTTTTKSGITANSAAIPLDGLASQSFSSVTNRITTSGYDNAGNMTRGKAPDGSLQRFEYDEAGRIKHIKTDSGTILETNTYATSRERLKKESSGTRTYYAWGGSSVMAEHVETGSETTMKWSKSYVYAGSRLLSTSTKNGSSEKLEYHHPDRLGTKMVSDPVAANEKEQATLPFGTEISAETQATTNQRFTSYDRSGVTGLDYAVNRTYNSGQSRFTQVDPIGMASASPSNPQSLNLYSYTLNNPVNLIDPSGLDELNNNVPIDFAPDFLDWLGEKGIYNPESLDFADLIRLDSEFFDKKTGRNCKDFAKFIVDTFYDSLSVFTAAYYLASYGYNALRSYNLPDEGRLRTTGRRRWNGTTEDGVLDGGFRLDLVNFGQHGDIYAHIYINAALEIFEQASRGTVDGWARLGKLIVKGQSLIERASSDDPEHQIEVNNDEAGTKVGQILNNARNSRKTALTKIEKVLCDPGE